MRSITLLLWIACSAHASDRLTPEQAVSLRSVRDAVQHPTSKQIAFVRSLPRSADDEPGGDFSQIWLASGPQQARPLTRGGENASSPRFAPDGSRLAFLAQRDEHSDHKQVFAIALDGGEAQPLTRHDTSVQSFAWSPNGKFIAFTATDAKSDDQKTAEDEGRDWEVVDESHRYTRTWVHDIDKSVSWQLFEEPRSVGNFTWLPDSSGLVLSAAPSPNADDQMMFGRLYTVSIDGGPLQAICETQGKLGGLSVSPDGKKLAFAGAVSLNDPLAQTTFVVDLPRGLAHPLGLGEVSVAQLDWVDSRNLLVLVNAGTETRLVRASLSQQATTGQPLPCVVHSFDLNRKTGRLALSADTPTHPSELFVASNWQSKPQRWTNSNPQLNALQLARQETVRWQSHGLEIAGVLTYPVDYQSGRRYPTILHPHGGPEGVSQDGWNLLPQMLAARGYVVLQPNYRGSGGRGVAFSKGDHDDLGGVEFQDILNGLRKLVDDGVSDPRRVGIGGWSYGGYLSALAATHHTDVFKAAIMGAGISNWLSFSGTTDIPHEMSLVHWNRYAYDNQQLFWERSPLSKIQQARTPTLILHGAGDDRVGPGQARELYTALKIREVPTQLVLYPRAGHGVREKAHRIDLYTRQLDWFDTYVK